jgi:heme/copper-type cytochrome/quinol oxidase subunit 2
MVDLQTTILWLATLVLLVVYGLLIHTLTRLRPDLNSNHNLTQSRILEAIWIIFPAAILVILLVLTFKQ